MSISSSRRQERKEETRHELLAAAIRLFADHGFHRTSLQQIAEAAGYTTGAIYWHFRNKDELFLAAFEEFAVTRVGELEEAMSGGGDLPERARRAADRWMARQAADPRFLVVALEFVAHAWRSPALRPAVATRAAAMRLATQRVLEREARVAELALPMPAYGIATVMRELGVGLALAKLADPEAVPDTLYGDFVERFFELALRDSKRARSGRVRGGQGTTGGKR
jgi:AcrR family transcriptional regulator